MEPMEIIRQNPMPFAELLGIAFTAATPDKVEATLLVRKELCTRPDMLHGGALMALADSLGAAGTVLNLPKGASTTTIESKTNFFAAAPIGETVRAVCEPVHRGRTTMVWQTRVFRQDGKLAAQVTQTQLVIVR